MKRVYIAGKLNADAVDYIKNVHKMIYYANIIQKMGFSVFVPCLDLLLGMVDGNWNYDDYFNNNQSWLDVSDIVFVCPNFEGSNGTIKEITRAKELGISVCYTLDQLKEYAI